MGAVTAAAIVLILAVAYQRERSAVMETQQRELMLFAIAAAHAVANAQALEAKGADDAVGQLLGQLALDPQVRAIALLDGVGRPLSRRGTDASPAIGALAARRALARNHPSLDTDVRARRARLSIPIPSGDRTTARLLDIEVDISQSLARFGHFLWFGVAAMVLLTIAIVVILYASLRSAVIRPLTQLATQSARLGSGDLAARSGLDARNAGSRELHQLAQAFDSMAAHMQASEAALEERARERTRELELVVAELESFSYAISHDLRSPLRSIDGFALILADRLGTGLSDEGRAYIERIRQQAQHMGSLIDNLLMLAHVSRVDLDRVQVDLSGLAAECIARARRGDPGRRVEVTIQPELVAHADAELLRVAMTQLVDNAWKFTRDAAQARIEIGVETRHNRAAAFVRDNGVGFDPAYVERLFTPFRRLHSPREFSGTGIGLAIVQRVIQRHGGQIWAESEPGRGATFYFTLASG